MRYLLAVLFSSAGRWALAGSAGNVVAFPLGFAAIGLVLGRRSQATRV